MSWPATITRINPDREISKDEWIQFAQTHPRLLLQLTEFSAPVLHLSGPKNLYIFWSNGCINCGAPTPEIIEIMFQCADELGAVVIGPRGHKYTSLDDWEKRTRAARVESVENEKRIKQQKHKERLLLTAIVCVGLLLGFILALIFP
jgi:hypothetical protein